MADAIGTATGIVGVVGVIIQVTQLLVDFRLNWKDAPGNVTAFIAELQSLKTVLSETNTNVTLNPEFAKAHLNNQSTVLSQLGPAAPTTTDTKALLEICHRELEGLANGLRERARKQHVSWERLKSVFLSESLRESVENLHRQCQILNILTTIDIAALSAATHNKVKEARLENQNWQSEQETRQMLSWLCPEDNGLQLSDYLRRRQEGTGDWILNTDEFREWADGDRSCTLFCPGDPGAGKTFMSSMILDELHRRFRDDITVGITFFYFNFKSKNELTAEDILANLLKQFVIKSPSVSDSLSWLCRLHRNPLYEELSHALDTVISQHAKTFIVLDTLDESWPSNGSLEKILSTIFELQSQYHINLLATSRSIPDITAKFSNSPSVEIRASDGDIEKYLRGHMFGLTPYVTNDDLREEVISTIKNTANGM